MMQTYPFVDVFAHAGIAARKCLQAPAPLLHRGCDTSNDVRCACFDLLENTSRNLLSHTDHL